MTFNEVGASQYLSQLLGEEPVQTIEKIDCDTDADGNVTAYAPDGSQAVLQLDPFSITFYSPEGDEIQKINNITGDSTGSKVSGELIANEAVIGTGERFNGCNQRGKKLDIYTLDEWNVIDGNGYFSIPLFLTSRGAGIFVNLNEYMTADLGNEDHSTWTVRVQKRTMDMYIFTSGDIKDAIYGYDVLSGFSDMPEDWSYGMIVCRYSPEFSDTASVKAMVEKMEENNLQWSAVILEAWSIYDTTKWQELKSLCTYLHSLGKKVLCYIRMGTIYTNVTTVPDSTYLVKLQSNGSTALPDVSKNNLNPDSASGAKTHTYLDVTNPDAVEWFYNDIWSPLINDIGIDGAKVDFCETFADNETLTFANGVTSGSHHWYPTYFTTLFYRMFASKPDGGMVFTRGGGIGSQRNPITWAGDQTREFSRLKAQLSGVLSSGLSGIPFMSFDMAGYRVATNATDKAKEKEIFIRGTEWSTFTTCMQTHGLVTRPYDFDTETVDIYRTYTDLHEDLIPYIRELAKIATETGLPVVRHLALGWQDDSKVYNIDDEFMMGDGLLVAPVLSDATSRTVYLPEGEWKDLATGEIYKVGKEGKTMYVNVSLSSVPVYLNMNHTSQVLDGLVDTISAVLKSMK